MKSFDDVLRVKEIIMYASALYEGALCLEH
jgi:hypothetical protein